MGREKIRVLHILNTGSYSGAENVAITIIKSTRDVVDSIYLSLEGSISEYLMAENIQYYPVERLSPKIIRHAIRELKPDIIHAHDFTAGIVSSISTFRIPIINHLHNNPPWIQHLSYRTIIYGISCFHYKRILTVSPSVMNEYVFGHFFKAKSIVVGNPIDIEEIRRKGKTNITTSDYKSDIVFLGRLMEQKNPLEFVRIIAGIRKVLPDIQAFIVGDGDLRNSVEELIDELGLRKNIKLLGFQINPYPFLSETKLMCMTSSWEGFGLAAVEALSFGKPVYATPVGGLPTIVNNTCGMLCENEEQFVKEITSCLTDREVYSSKCRGAAIQAEKLNNITEYKKHILSVFRNCLT